jgi:endogenous inhibitor of DNA gyrase (YacG/DUF329 family)
MATQIELTCSVCNKAFERRKAEHDYRLKENPDYRPVCSKECMKKLRANAQLFDCKQCGQSVSRTPGELKGTNHSNTCQHYHLHLVSSVLAMALANIES